MKRDHNHRLLMTNKRIKKWKKWNIGNKLYENFRTWTQNGRSLRKEHKHELIDGYVIQDNKDIFLDKQIISLNQEATQ